MAAFAACDSPLGIRHPVVLGILAERQLSRQATAIEQRGLGRWFLEAHPDKAALYAQINHFNPSAYAASPERWGATLSALMEPDRLMPMEALRQLACPTLVLVGSEDPIVPVAVAREMAEWVPAAELAVVQDAGHSTYFEKPLEFNRLVLEFIGRRACYRP